MSNDHFIQPPPHDRHSLYVDIHFAFITGLDPTQARDAAERDRQVGAEDASNVRDGVAQSRRSTEPRMDSLYDT